MKKSALLAAMGGAILAFASCNSDSETMSYVDLSVEPETFMSSNYIMVTNWGQKMKATNAIVKPNDADLDRQMTRVIFTESQEQPANAAIKNIYVHQSIPLPTKDEFLSMNELEQSGDTAIYVSTKTEDIIYCANRYLVLASYALPVLAGSEFYDPPVSLGVAPEIVSGAGGEADTIRMRLQVLKETGTGNLSYQPSFLAFDLTDLESAVNGFNNTEDKTYILDLTYKALTEDPIENAGNDIEMVTRTRRMVYNPTKPYVTLPQ